MFVCKDGRIPKDILLRLVLSANDKHSSLICLVVSGEEKFYKSLTPERFVWPFFLEVVRYHYET